MIETGVDNKPSFAVSPATIAVIGGGRWARVLIEVLCGILDPSAGISVYSKHNASAMSEWAQSLQTGHTIRVFEEIPEQFSQPAAAIVVNAARDHEKVTLASIAAGAFVLVEKPLSLSYRSSLEMVETSRKKKLELSCAHVFLFSRYFENFSKLVSATGTVEKITIHWMDPAAESRYGEQKKYDAGLPIFADLLPHILSMAESLVKGAHQKLVQLSLSRGGASLKIELTLNEVPCYFVMTRNGNKRERLIEVTAGGKVLSLDFSAQPGIIRYDNKEIIGDADWQTKDGPAAGMLRAFLKGTAGYGFDKRLDANIGLKVNQMIDDVFAGYRSLQMNWIIENLIPSKMEHEDMLYALTELFQSCHFSDHSELKNKITAFTKAVSGPQREHWLTKLKDKKDASVIMEMGAV